MLTVEQNGKRGGGARVIVVIRGTNVMGCGGRGRIRKGFRRNCLAVFVARTHGYVYTWQMAVSYSLG